jgi:hypothetical protein
MLRDKRLTVGVPATSYVEVGGAALGVAGVELELAVGAE